MMKDVADTKTVDLVGGVPAKRGRPSTGAALSAAERKRRSRLARGVAPVAVELSLDVIERMQKYLLGKDMTQSQLIEKLLRTQLLRPR